MVVVFFYSFSFIFRSFRRDSSTDHSDSLNQQRESNMMRRTGRSVVMSMMMMTRRRGIVSVRRELTRAFEEAMNGKKAGRRDVEQGRLSM